MQKQLSNDEILCLEHGEFMRQVSESGVPIHLLRMYGDKPFNTKQNDYNQKTGKAPNMEPYPNGAL